MSSSRALRSLFVAAAVVADSREQHWQIDRIPGVAKAADLAAIGPTA